MRFLLCAQPRAALTARCACGAAGIAQGCGGFALCSPPLIRPAAAVAPPPPGKHDPISAFTTSASAPCKV